MTCLPTICFALGLILVSILALVILVVRWFAKIRIRDFGRFPVLLVGAVVVAWQNFLVYTQKWWITWAGLKWSLRDGVDHREWNICKMRITKCTMITRRLLTTIMQANMTASTMANRRHLKMKYWMHFSMKKLISRMKIYLKIGLIAP